jgi:hypothetical protein
MRAPVLLAGCLLFRTISAGAAAGAPADGVSANPDATAPARLRLDLRGGVGIRHDTVELPAARSDVRGGTVSDLALAAAWISAEAPLGLAARFELTHFALRGAAGGEAAGGQTATGLDATAALVGRLRPGDGRVVLEGQVGYAFLQEPLARALPAGAAGQVVDDLRTHGPVVGGSIGLVLSDALAFEASGRFVPMTFGGRYQDVATSVRRLAFGAGASIGSMQVGGARLAGLVAYEIGGTSASANGVEIQQRRQQIAIGLRATALAPTRAAAVRPRPELGAYTPHHIRGVVRAETSGGALAEGETESDALAGVTVALPDGGATRTGADGAFVLTVPRPGLVKLVLSRADLVAGEEIVAVPADGDVTVALRLRRIEAPAPAVIMGFVRSDNGAAVTAEVRLLERGLAVQASAGAPFRFEVPAGRYTLTIAAPGFVTQSKSVAARPGEHNIYDVDLQAER